MIRASLDSSRCSINPDQFYEGLPEEYASHYVFLEISGHSILCIPQIFWEEAEEDGEYDDYEIAVPVKYVLEKGATKKGDYFVIDVPYDDEDGLQVDSSYYELF